MGRADHEFVCSPRGDDVEGNARVQKAHGASERHLARSGMRIISPRTPRNSGKAPCEPPSRRQSTTTFRLARRFSIHTKSGFPPPLRAQSARSASTMRSADQDDLRPRKKRPSAGNGPQRSGSSSAMPGSSTDACAFVRVREAVDLACVAAAARPPGVPLRFTSGTRASHQSIAPRPSATSLCGALSPLAERSQHPAREPRCVAAELARNARQA